LPGAAEKWFVSIPAIAGEIAGSFLKRYGYKKQKVTLYISFYVYEKPKAGKRFYIERIMLHLSVGRNNNYRFRQYI